MAADLLGRQGWEIESVTGASHDEIVDDVARSEAKVVGLTAHGARSLDPLIRLILAIRATKPATYILVSGKFVTAAAAILELIGADGLAADVPTGLAELLYEAAQTR